MSDLEKEIKELKFKLKALSNFVYQHHHRVDLDIFAVPIETTTETSKPKVWVSYPDGFKEEPSDEE